MASRKVNSELEIELLVNKGISLKSRTITLTGEVSERMFKIVDMGLTELEKLSSDPVTVKVCSGGGYAYAGMAIVGRIKSSPIEVHTEGYGLIASAATAILACGDTRRVSKYAQFMWHESSTSLEGRLSTLKHDVKQMNKENDQWAEVMSTFTKKDKSFWLKHGIHVDVYFTPEELLECGVVDKII